MNTDFGERAIIRGQTRDLTLHERLAVSCDLVHQGVVFAGGFRLPVCDSRHGARLFPRNDMGMY
jgi:hypothetical protein